MKIKTFLVPLSFFASIVVSAFAFYFYINNWPLPNTGTYGQLKPEVTTNLNSKKFIKSGSSSSAMTIAEKILGAKLVLPMTVVVTDKGDNLLVLIDKKIRLPADYVPGDLITVEGFPSAKMRTEAAANLLAMFAAAKNDGLNLSIVSAYRSYSEQEGIFNSWVASAGLKSAESFSAHPGFSQHQLGTAVDIGAVGKTTFSDSFGKTLEGVWLATNAYKYGFIISYPFGKEAITGYSYEPWHYRYIGQSNALALANSGLILEEYLQRFGTW